LTSVEKSVEWEDQETFKGKPNAIKPSGKDPSVDNLKEDRGLADQGEGLPGGRPP